MKKPYNAPCIAVERFSLTQHIASCTAVKINSTDMWCVISDSDASPAMVDLAFQNGFLSGSCDIPVNDGDAGFCYHVSTAMAFTS